MIANIIVVVVLLGIVGVAAAYLVRAKKNGQHCIGCPSGGKCNGKCHCNDTKK